MIIERIITLTKEQVIKAVEEKYKVKLKSCTMSTIGMRGFLE